MKNEVVKEMNKSISVKLPSLLLEKAREKSKETGVAVSFVVRKAIEEWIGENQLELGEKASKPIVPLSMGKTRRKS